MPILIAEATAEAVHAALVRQWCHRVSQRLPPHADVTAEAADVAGELLGVLVAMDALRGTRRDVRGLRARAEMLTGRLAALGVVPPA